MHNIPVLHDFDLLLKLCVLAVSSSKLFLKLEVFLIAVVLALITAR
jgi:hypothetical protein